jgi:coenzyme PQQ precursor peptide PqqA
VHDMKEETQETQRDTSEVWATPEYTVIETGLEVTAYSLATR